MHSDLAAFPLSFLQTWQPTIQAAGSPQERPANSEQLPNRSAFYTFWHWHYQSRNHARRNKTNNLSASHWLSHTLPTGKQRVNMFQICPTMVWLYVCVCVCVRDCPSWLLLTRVLKRWSLHVCRPPSYPPKKCEKLKKNVQVYVHGDDDRTRTKGPSLPFNALLLHSPI